ncbi:MAG: cupin domain-containing protein [Lachnospiraceae bacterium]|nr:cupin domain-containing protein [Lachnospiraceae bacterium]
MNLVLLSGGSGKRLWPLSNEIRSKQFIKLFQTEDGGHESMVQRMFRQIKEVDRQGTITVATSRTQASAIQNQLGEGVDICVEPCRRDTFPAIALATLYLRDVKGKKADEVVVVCPVDPFVNQDYFESLLELEKLAVKGQAKLSLLGMEPTYPSAKYGYILPVTGDRISKVKSFKEKPDEQLAAEYISQGGLWNGGIFAFQIGYLCEKIQQITGLDTYEKVFKAYDTLEKISFDYQVVEKEESVQVLRFLGNWKDLGTWNTLTEAMPEETIGNVICGCQCENTHVINELDVPVVCLGLKDMVVAASPEGILVSDKHQSSYMKPIVEQIHQQIRFAEKSWGSFRVVDVEENSLTIKVTLNPGHQMNYHSHTRRDEVWTVIQGTGYAILDGEKYIIKTGTVLHMPKGCKHTVVAETELKIMEVQMGNDIDVADKIKHEL